MADSPAGGFEYGGRGYRFNEGKCYWRPVGALWIEASGNRCGLTLVGVPFPGITQVADLPGRIWEPDEKELSWYADTFAEGGLEVRDKRLWIMRGRIECRRFDAERHILTITFRLVVQDGEYGRQDEADGVVYARTD